MTTSEAQDHYITALTHVDEHRDIRLARPPVIIFACRCGQLFYCQNLKEPKTMWEAHLKGEA